MSKFFVLHGHFYQPPREDPWWMTISRQDSAYPSHDWNDKIYWECYLPNATARIFDRDSKIIQIINNYSYINFDFGPTLLLWLRSRHPEFIELIRSADLKSIERNGGHGNAIAQPYNHMIMPLASDRDKDTQLFWGLRFFEHIFHRKSEGIWLPEAACNIDTLRHLKKHDIKYVVLAPNQVEKVRKIGRKEWQDVSDGSVDVGQPYRIFLDSDKAEYIDCFFYQGDISHAISFQHIMHSARSCAKRIASSYSSNQLLSLATDGETFGHHHPFSEMCLAYLMKYELPSEDIKVTNYGKFLEDNPPKYEACIKEGENGLGTSWSCSHGIRRWYDDCGCRTVNKPGWDQSWRGPLRDALDWLREEIDKIFTSKGNEVLNNPWKARDEFIQVLIEPDSEALNSFLEKHCKNRERISSALKLLDMERMRMLYYTSCGWFFDEISGIEPVQNLRYAARAIELAKEESGIDLEEGFLERLELAKSNIREFKNGRVVYEKFVKPQAQGWDNYISSYLIKSSFFESGTFFYKFKIEEHGKQKITQGDNELEFGVLTIEDRISLDSSKKIYILLKKREDDRKCFLRDFENGIYREIEERFQDGVWISDNKHLKEILDRFFPDGCYRVKDIYSGERERILEYIFRNKRDNIFNLLGDIWDNNVELMEEYRNIGLLLPYEMHLLGASIMHSQIKEILELFKDTRDLRRIDELKRLFVKIDKMRLDMDMDEVGRIVTDIATEISEELLKEPLKKSMVILKSFHQEMLNLKIDYYRYIVQNNITTLIKSNSELIPELKELADIYDVNWEKFDKS
jgi:alpha-amylase/alpha-mannosidase (GH57 family)